MPAMHRITDRALKVRFPRQLGVPLTRLALFECTALCYLFLARFVLARSEANARFFILSLSRKEQASSTL
jgi:hypothetical protein